MLCVFRHLVSNDVGALTPKYTLVSGSIAVIIALSSIAAKFAMASH